jgi:hypothetical protein
MHDTASLDPQLLPFNWGPQQEVGPQQKEQALL